MEKTLPGHIKWRHFLGGLSYQWIYFNMPKWIHHAHHKLTKGISLFFLGIFSCWRQEEKYFSSHSYIWEGKGLLSRFFFFFLEGGKKDGDYLEMMERREEASKWPGKLTQHGIIIVIIIIIVKPWHMSKCER